MARLTERELTRLSYLMAALVASPQLSRDFIEQEQEVTSDSLPESPAQASFRDLVRFINDLIKDVAKGEPPTWQTLHRVANGLKQESDVEKQTAGHILASALQSAPESANS